MTVYNGEFHLQDAPASILGQILKACDLTITDGGFVDRTPDILGTYGHQQKVRLQNLRRV